MRIDRLELIRYGKFTDRAVELPRAEHDLHVIVGANEAGKSTLRSALVHLLYGFPTRQFAYAFLHPLTDLRLGAQLSHDGSTLAFQRIKASRATLRAPDQTVLPDDALAGLLGGTDARFFEQMFCLDHDRLVRGGASILSATDDDVGQVLFESAAGIASLGRLREQLEQEADALWARRKSGARAYYQAEQVHEQARHRLKAASLRAKDWSQAHDRVQELDARLRAAMDEHAALKARRGVLQRIRRVAPLLAALDSHRAALQDYAGGPELAVGAAATLEQAEQRLAAIGAAHAQHLRVRDAAQSAIAQLRPDTPLLELQAEIVALDELRVQYRAHPADIDRRRQELQARWAAAAELAAQLGWQGLGEAELAARLPSQQARAALAALARRHEPLAQAVQAGERALRDKQLEIEQARREQARLAAGEVSAALRAAMTQARQLGDFATGLRNLRDDAARHERALALARGALGHPDLDMPSLAGMLPPSRERVQGLVDEDQREHAESISLERQLQRADEQIAGLEAAVRRTRDARHPVLLDDVRRARAGRDQTWQALRRDPSRLHEHAADYERLVEQADALADERHDRAHDAAELQGLQDRLAQSARERAALVSQQQALAAGRARREDRWRELRREARLPELSYHAAAQWLTARDHALQAWQDLLEAGHRVEQFQHAGEQAAQALAEALRELGLQPCGPELAQLLAQAEPWVREQDESRVRRHALQQQIDAAADAREPLQREAEAARAALLDWSSAWSRALADCGFAESTDAARAEAALELVRRIDEALGAVRGIRSERIDAMQADLRDLDSRAEALAQRVAPELRGRPGPDIAIELQRRLGEARTVQAELLRQRASLADAEQALAAIEVEHRHIDALLEPLLQRAGTSERNELRRAIEASDQRRRLQDRIDEAMQALLAQGDGLPLQALRDEAAGIAPEAVQSELAQLEPREDELLRRMNELSASQQGAQAQLQAMAGGADAASAEADRQEALAQMAEAVERYIKVRTASRLLSWSIERYRDARQGPMLAAASRIFAELTLGSFERLVVDFDSQPPTLQGRRADGRSVGVDGMSDGTRDQLYLALRLAALDMHLGHAHALPFVADDLFINFDDPRTRAGLRALADLSRHTQVLLLTHHEHLLELVRSELGDAVDTVRLD